GSLQKSIGVCGGRRRQSLGNDDEEEKNNNQQTQETGGLGWGKPAGEEIDTDDLQMLDDGQLRADDPVFVPQ
ncbi:MAG: hypothetical protein AB7O88_13230, partial [Reyranellaceae bacterium]